jgi:predicted nucleic acid-binding Zn ribbon protein
MSGSTEGRPGRHCIKCGREIGPDETICATCNRAGMATPSATQYHGTMVAAIIAGVAALAIAASLAMRGIGPFDAQVLASAPRAGDTLAVELAVANEGQRAGRARCQLIAYDGSGRTVRTRSFVTAEIAGGQRAEISQLMPGITAAPRRLTVRCEG